MQRDEMAGVIRRHNKKLRLLAARAVAQFAPDDIHAFRVQVKKLRAFTRMAEPNGGKLPGRLHDFYHCMGSLRNLQLLQQTLARSRWHRHHDLRATVLQNLDQQIDTIKKQAATLIHGKHAFGKKMPGVKRGLPVRLSRPQKRAFIGRTQSVADPLALTELADDQRLHTVRKALKDLLYVWPYLGNPERKIAASPFGGYGSMKKDGDLLGAYIDACFRLGAVEEKNGVFAGVDKSIVQQISREWRREKVRLYQQIEKRPGIGMRLVVPDPDLPQSASYNPLSAGNPSFVSNELHLD